MTLVDGWLARSALCAHRGGSGDWPEQTAYAYSNAAAWNPDLALEVSVWRTADGVWICSHDKTTGRVFGTDLDVTTSTWADLAPLRAMVGGYPLARLVEVLDAHAHGGRVLFIDNKGQQAPAELLALLAGYGGADRFVAKGFYTASVWADFARAAGYAGWGYGYEADADGMVAAGARWSLLGMDYTASSTAWAKVSGTGRPVLAHIVANPAGAATAWSKGAAGLMVSGVTAVVPKVTATPSTEWLRCLGGAWVPHDVELCNGARIVPELTQLAGSATYDATTGVYNLPDRTATVYWWASYNGQPAWHLTLDAYTTEASTQYPPDGGRLLNSTYFAADRKTLVNNDSGIASNGNAFKVPLNAWTAAPWLPALPLGGPAIRWIRIQVSNAAPYVGTSCKVRNPVLVVP